jgi:hypothetical protein
VSADDVRAIPAVVLLAAVAAKLALLVAEAVTVALLLSLLSRLGGLATAGLGFGFAAVGQRLTVSSGGWCGCTGRLSLPSIGPRPPGVRSGLAAVEVDASLLESAVMTVTTVCAGLAGQAACVAILARHPRDP